MANELIKINNNPELIDFYSYMENGGGYEIESEKDWFDKCLEWLGEQTITACKSVLETMKKKYMIGKYSKNIRKMNRLYADMKPIYNDICKLSSICEDNSYDLSPDSVEELTRVIVKLEKKLNKACEKIAKNFMIQNNDKPINFVNPDEACFNYGFIGSYMSRFSKRKDYIKY